MATHSAIDEKLIEAAMRLGGHASRKEAVIAALQEYVMRRKQLEILSLFGMIDFDKS